MYCNNNIKIRGGQKKIKMELFLKKVDFFLEGGGYIIIRYGNQDQLQEFKPLCRCATSPLGGEKILLTFTGFHFPLPGGIKRGFDLKSRNS
jgi:hypothetical protein